MSITLEAPAYLDQMFSEGCPSIQDAAALDNSANFPCVSGARAETNRQNAQKSTGPTTKEGKKRVSMNALQHGLYSKSPLLPDEDPAEYQALACYFRTHYAPLIEHERRLVDEIIDADWRAKRYRRAAVRILSVAAAEHESNLDETFDIDLHDVVTRRATATALAFRSEQKLIAQLQRQTARLERQIDRLKQELFEAKAMQLEFEQAQREAAQTEPEQPNANPSTQVSRRSGNGFVPSLSANPAPQAELSGARPARMPKFSGPHRKQARKNWLKSQKKAVTA
jgi:hypothetical protein